MSIHPILAATAALLACSTATRAEEPVNKDVITSLGSHTSFEGKLTVKVAAEKGDLSFHLTRVVAGGKVTELFTPKVKAEGTVWAVYPETADRVWIFCGDSLYRVEYEEKPSGFATSGKVFTGSEAVKIAPDKLLKAVPKEHVDKLRGK